MSVVRVIVCSLHVGRALDSGYEKPEGDASKQSFPESIVSEIPHLLVEIVDLLESLNIVLFHRSVGDGPKSEIMHVG